LFQPLTDTPEDKQNGNGISNDFTKLFDELLAQSHLNIDFHFKSISPRYFPQQFLPKEKRPLWCI